MGKLTGHSFQFTLEDSICLFPGDIGAANHHAANYPHGTLFAFCPARAYLYSVYLVIKKPECYPAFRQHVTWNIPITPPSAPFQAVTLWGVGSSWIEHPFCQKYSLASFDSSTRSLCPVTMINRFAPVSNMRSASSSEIL